MSSTAAVAQRPFLPRGVAELGRVGAAAAATARSSGVGWRAVGEAGRRPCEVLEQHVDLVGATRPRRRVRRAAGRGSASTGPDRGVGGGAGRGRPRGPSWCRSSRASSRSAASPMPQTAARWTMRPSRSGVAEQLVEEALPALLERHGRRGSRRGPRTAAAGRPRPGAPARMRWAKPCSVEMVVWSTSSRATARRARTLGGEGEVDGALLEGRARCARAARPRRPR